MLLDQRDVLGLLTDVRDKKVKAPRWHHGAISRYPYGKEDKLTLKNMTSNLKNKVQPALDKTKDFTQPHMDKVKGITQPHIDKFKDGVDDINGKHLEEKLSEYTDVYGEVLLGLHRRAEADRQAFQEQLHKLQGQVETLEATVQQMSAEGKYLKGK